MSSGDVRDICDQLKEQNRLMINIISLLSEIRNELVNARLKQEREERKE